MASQSILSTVATLQDQSGAYAVSVALVPDVAAAAAATAAAAAAADTAAATGTTDAAAMVAYANTIGLTGTVVAAVTLTAAQANSLEAKLVLVQSDLATVKTDTASTLVDATAGTAFTPGASQVLVAYDTTNVQYFGQLRDAVIASVKQARGSGLKA